RGRPSSNPVVVSFTLRSPRKCSRKTTYRAQLTEQRGAQPPLTFTRKEFYDLVWSKPVIQVARDFFLSDVAIHKVCRKHDIPTLPIGWWAKKEAGKPVCAPRLRYRRRRGTLMHQKNPSFFAL
ncbi:MAG: hypothetical protein AB7G25_06105, partial [Sphingomonadaceae bacterium]